MPVGTISDPVSWALGTVLTPTWAQNVQDTVNELISTYSSSSVGVDVGYITIPTSVGDIKIQWKLTTAASGSIASDATETLNVSWPVAFANTNYLAFLTADTGDGACLSCGTKAAGNMDVIVLNARPGNISGIHPACLGIGL